uniref:Mitochondrial import inner membrane translocase subunit TIM50 n=1 Tax=Tanacetum cinerariifolium TaxID=118510 RepID=A0A6L2L6T5_TANCI|nr:hypothetical protein [Tanacetum cinerariifolium]
MASLPTRRVNSPSNTSIRAFPVLRNDRTRIKDNMIGKGGNTGEKLIIFDVNGMLADIVFPRPKDVEADKYSHRKEVFKRPYLDDFLSFCFDKFNVGIWSSRMKKNLDPVVNCLFGDLKKKLLFIWDASHCRNLGIRTLEDRYKCIVFKELRKVWEKTCRTWVKGTFNESNTLLLDDSPYKALLNPKHT